jgi:hypothetical protein
MSDAPRPGIEVTQVLVSDVGVYKNSAENCTGERLREPGVVQWRRERLRDGLGDSLLLAGWEVRHLSARRHR